MTNSNQTDVQRWLARREKREATIARNREALRKVEEAAALERIREECSARVSR
jgi:hypothetical protein